MEQPDYELYLFLFNSILQRFGITSEIKQKKFLFEKSNDLFKLRNDSLIHGKKNISFEELFSGYPLNINIDNSDN